MLGSLLASIAGCPNVLIKGLAQLTGRTAKWTLTLAIISVLALQPFASATAQGLRPYEPLDPAKAQTLPITPLTIESNGSIYHFFVEVADTPSEHAIGLMHRNYLAPDRGMLFDYKSPQRLRFWMRNTFISLDMLFIRGDGEVAFIAESTVPHSELTIGPRELAQAVLEVPAGTVARLGLETGDVVRHPIFGNASSP